MSFFLASFLYFLLYSIPLVSVISVLIDLFYLFSFYYFIIFFIVTLRNPCSLIFRNLFYLIPSTTLLHFSWIIFSHYLSLELTLWSLLSLLLISLLFNFDFLIISLHFLPLPYIPPFYKWIFLKVFLTILIVNFLLFVRPIKTKST